MAIWITKNRGSMKGSANSICYDYRNGLIQDDWIAKLKVEVSKVLPKQLFLVGIVNFKEVGVLADQERRSPKTTVTTENVAYVRNFISDRNHLTCCEIENTQVIDSEAAAV